MPCRNPCPRVPGDCCPADASTRDWPRPPPRAAACWVTEWIGVWRSKGGPGDRERPGKARGCKCIESQGGACRRVQRDGGNDDGRRPLHPSQPFANRWPFLPPSGPASTDRSINIGLISLGSIGAAHPFDRSRAIGGRVDRSGWWPRAGVSKPVLGIRRSGDAQFEATGPHERPTNSSRGSSFGRLARFVSGPLLFHSRRTYPLVLF